MQPDSEFELPQDKAIGRRSILRGIGAVTVAADGAALAYGTTVSTAEAARLEPGKSQGESSTHPSADGYRLTDNVRTYYRTARY